MSRVVVWRLAVPAVACGRRLGKVVWGLVNVRRHGVGRRRSIYGVRTGILLTLACKGRGGEDWLAAWGEFWGSCYGGLAWLSSWRAAFGIFVLPWDWRFRWPGARLVACRTALIFAWPRRLEWPDTRSIACRTAFTTFRAQRRGSPTREASRAGRPGSCGGPRRPHALPRRRCGRANNANAAPWANWGQSGAHRQVRMRESRRCGRRRLLRRLAPARRAARIRVGGADPKSTLRPKS